MSGSACTAVRSWRIENVSGDHRYRFTNLVDHTAWQVVLHRHDGHSIAIPGHVSYARGTFEETLAPGQYRLTWHITPSLLPPRDGDAPRLEEQSATFSVPIEGSTVLEVSEGC